MGHAEPGGASTTSQGQPSTPQSCSLGGGSCASASRPGRVPWASMGRGSGSSCYLPEWGESGAAESAQLGNTRYRVRGAIGQRRARLSDTAQILHLCQNEGTLALGGSAGREVAELGRELDMRGIATLASIHICARSTLWLARLCPGGKAPRTAGAGRSGGQTRQP